MRNLGKMMIALLAIMVAIFAFADPVNPQQALSEIMKFRADKLAEDRKANVRTDIKALNEQVKEKSKAAVAGVKVADIDAKDALAWAQLFGMAEDSKSACDAADKYIKGNPDAKDKFRAYSIMLTACNSLGEVDMLLALIPKAEFSTPNDAMMLAMNTAFTYSETIAKAKGPDAAILAIDQAWNRVPKPADSDAQAKTRYYGSYANVVDVKVDLLTEANRKADALKALDEAIATLGDNPSARSLKGAKVRLTLIDTAAPAITNERGYGEFPGLEALKGKVVILDFFAHWCGPCIASFPDMKQLYSDFKGKGLEIFAVTTYYGYYKSENTENRDMSKDVEFGKMKDFIAEHSLPWPVVYGPRTNFEAYGVTGIPHVAVIDRDGKVHKIKVGYSAESFKAFRAEIEKLVAQK